MGALTAARAGDPASIGPVGEIAATLHSAGCYGCARMAQSPVGRLIAGVVPISASISYAAIVFGGRLEPHLGLGIGLALFGTMVLCGVIAWGSSLPGMLANAQLDAAVILGIMASSTVAAPGPQVSDRELLGTLLLMIVLASLSFGVVMLLMGTTRQGNLARYGDRRLLRLSGLAAAEVGSVRHAGRAADPGER